MFMEQLWVLSISIASFLSLFLLNFFLQNQTRRKNLAPSPPSLPIIGHFHLIKHPIHRSLEHLSKRYGPILTLKFGSRLVLVISSPSAIEECFSKNDILFANRPRLLAGKHLNYDYTAFGASSYGDHWRNLRRFTTLEIFSTTRLNMFLSIRQEEVRSVVKNLVQASHDDGFCRVEMKSRLFELSFNIIMRMVAGKRYFGREVEDLGEARQFQEIISEAFELSGGTNPGDFISFLRWIDFQSMEKRMLKLRKEMDSFFDGLIEEHRNKNKAFDRCGGISKNMIDSMLSFQESEPNYYSDDLIKGNIMTMVTAGTDTSALTIEWAMSLLVNHPEVLKKTRTEMDNNIGVDRLVDEPDLSKLPYLQGIINETLRLYPVAPLLVPHLSSEDCTVGGFHVPRGTMLLVNAWAVHRDPKIWEDPTSFKPERFLDAKVDRAYKLVPFGLGRRACPGAGLANRVVGLALGTLIQCFEWERISEELVDMSEGRGITMPKAKPLEVMCRPRQNIIHVLSQL